MEIIYYTLSQS